jgi:hypothetical protein
LIWDDPDRYFQLRLNLAKEIETYSSLEPAQIRKHIQAIVENYPSFGAFNVIPTLEYMLYRDAEAEVSIETCRASYCAAVRFEGLKMRSDPHWKWGTSQNRDNYEHLDQYCQRVRYLKAEEERLRRRRHETLG